MKLFRISDEAMVEKEQNPENIDPILVEETPCPRCNYTVCNLYTLADSQFVADQQYLSGKGGECAECMIDRLFEGYEVTKEE